MARAIAFPACRAPTPTHLRNPEFSRLMTRDPKSSLPSLANDSPAQGASRKVRTAIVCDAGWLAGYIAHEHYYLIHLLQSDYGFDVIDSETTDFSDPAIVQKLNSYDAVLIAYQRVRDIPLDKVSAYKIFRVDDLEHYSDYNQCIARFIQRSDMVISPYAYAFRDFYQHDNVVWVPYSAGIEAFAEVGFNDRPLPKVLVSGSIAWDRPFRQYAANLTNEQIEILPHPGYGGRYYENNASIAVRAQYYREMNRYLCGFADAHKYRYLHLKVFEIASVGSLLLADRLIEKEMNELGFIDYHTCIFSDQNDFVEKVTWICDEANRAEVDRIRRAGMELVRERHLTRHRARQLNEVIETAVASRKAAAKSGQMNGVIFSESYGGEALRKWQVAHEMTAQLADGALAVSDSRQYSYHLLRVSSPEYLYRMVRLECVVRKLPTTSANFYVHHYGNRDVAEVAFDGTIVNRGISSLLSVHHRAPDLLVIELEFLNCHPTLSIGCAKDGRAIYAGTGEEQFAIEGIAVETRDATSALSRVPPSERITLVDVGAQEGLQLQGMLRADCVTPVMFEPIPSEAEALRNTISRIPGGQVIESALANTSGTRKLHIAAASGCSSLLEPDFDILDRYPIAWIFRKVGERDVLCSRYDELFRQQAVPKPDVIKIDVQGFEYEVLLGFGHLLETCLGIELESHLYPIYREQKLLGEIVAYLEQFGFVLRAIRERPSFDGDFIECDAFFTKRKSEVIKLTAQERKKFALLTETWELRPYF
jgi:FkbM family methyltransferase